MNNQRNGPQKNLGVLLTLKSGYSTNSTIALDLSVNAPLNIIVVSILHVVHILKLLKYIIVVPVITVRKI